MEQIRRPVSNVSRLGHNGCEAKLLSGTVFQRGKPVRSGFEPGRLSRICRLGQLESGTRRTFVKSVVHLLGQRHRGEEKRLKQQQSRPPVVGTAAARRRSWGSTIWVILLGEPAVSPFFDLSPRQRFAGFLAWDCKKPSWLASEMVEGNTRRRSRGIACKHRPLRTLKERLWTTTAESEWRN